MAALAALIGAATIVTAAAAGPAAAAPAQIGLSGVSQIAAGDFDAAAVLSNGSVLMWGDNSEGQLGIGTT